MLAWGCSAFWSGLSDLAFNHLVPALARVLRRYTDTDDAAQLLLKDLQLCYNQLASLPRTIGYNTACDLRSALSVLDLFRVR
jgi:hypothetical protein